MPHESTTGRHLVLFDGLCGFCYGFVRFLLRHDRRGVFRFAPLQSGIGRTLVARAGGNPEQPSTFHVVADFEAPEARFLVKGDAALFVADQLGWPWRAFRMARFLPKALRDAVYDVIAAVRYQVSGRYDRCVLPTPETRSRFLE